MKRKKLVVCPDCRGRGRKYPDPDENGKAVPGLIETTKCETCGGLGKVPKKERSDNA